MSNGGIVSAARSRAANVHNNRSWRCTCGREIRGNGGRASHRKACDGHYLTWSAALEARRKEWEEEQRRLLPPNWPYE